MREKQRELRTPPTYQLLFQSFSLRLQFTLRLPSFHWLKVTPLYKTPSVPLPIEAFAISRLYRIPYLKYVSILYQVASFFEVSACTALSETLVADILDVWILVSAAGNLDLPQDSPNSIFIV